MNAAPGGLVSHAAAEELSAMLAWWRQHGRNKQRPPDVEDEPWGPDVYVAFTPPGGIPALTQSTTTGTGSAEGGDDVPGVAECRIYRIVDAATPSFDRIGRKLERVFNIKNIALPGGTWCVVMLTKPGQWVAVEGLRYASC